MNVDTARLLALAKAHPDRVCKLLIAAVDGVSADPTIIVDAVTVAEGGSPLAFAKAHPKFVASLLGEMSKNILLDPPLFLSLISTLKS